MELQLNDNSEGDDKSSESGSVFSFFRVLQFHPPWSLMALLRLKGVPHAIENVHSPVALGLPAPVAILVAGECSSSSSSSNNSSSSRSLSCQVLPLKNSLEKLIAISSRTQSKNDKTDDIIRDINLASFIELNLNRPLTHLITMGGDFNTALLSYAGIWSWVINKIQTDLATLLSPLPGDSLHYKSPNQLYEDLESSYKYLDSCIYGGALLSDWDKGLYPISQAVLFGHIMDAFCRFSAANGVTSMLENKFPNLIKFAKEMSKTLFHDIFSSADHHIVSSDLADSFNNNSNSNSNSNGSSNNNSNINGGNDATKFRKQYLFEANKALSENCFICHALRKVNPDSLALLSGVLGDIRAGIVAFEVETSVERGSSISSTQYPQDQYTNSASKILESLTGESLIIDSCQSGQSLISQISANISNISLDRSTFLYRFLGIRKSHLMGVNNSNSNSNYNSHIDIDSSSIGIGSSSSSDDSSNRSAVIVSGSSMDLKDEPIRVSIGGIVFSTSVLVYMSYYFLASS